MSAQDDRDQDGFLGRWIKRKAQARAHQPVEEKQGEAPKDAHETDAAPLEADTGKPREPGVARQGEPEEPAFDLSQLPKLEDISAETSLADFMRKEVPAALRNAALKRAWALDPAIRDYVNPAREYAYDWNVPDGVPGNGPLEAASEAMRKVAEAVQSKFPDQTFDLSDVTEAEIRDAEGQSTEPPKTPSAVRISDAEKLNPLVKASEEPNENQKENSAPRQRQSPDKNTERPRRRHGGAAPT